MKLKVPTASRSQGFGTGSFDEEAGARFAWSFFHRLYPFAQLGYRFVGRASGLNLRDITTYEAGASLALRPHRYLTLSVGGHTPLERGIGPTDELLAAYTSRLTRQWELQAYAVHGLTANSTQKGGGLGVYRHF